ncbi:glutaredoxin-related protein [Cardiosporidium cionae]|uniref:Glutaredoxin-related protein n=1 Tax=Cardiosporidium cionae TaxID=476202 RepID=A0ABQ7JEV8_9APIC|nr:glutaredoxin-related protein [Cardiosporidium cionae]|eukprot:KAF8822190.1 glutaredoxin-related protein [Cardiosporidium cionae]
MALEIASTEEWAQMLGNAQGRAVCIVYAEWHPPSRQMLQLAEPLSKDFEGIRFYHLDFEKRKDVLVANAQSISVVPTILFYHDGLVIGKLEGSDPPKFISALTDWQTGGALPSTVAVKPHESIKTTENAEGQLAKTLKALIQSEPVILFMKGSKAKPFCRFSRAAVNVLNELGVQYGTFDVFSDENIRAGLKDFSQWPTFPQLYVNGEFIGGVDIMNEMHETGSLAELFPANCLAETERSIDSQELDKLIKSEPIMLFMKGTPSNPECGFSKQLVQILEMAQLKYGYYNILSNKSVREALKAYQEWPTYPQLYAGGTFIGGLDIVKELIQADGIDGFCDELVANCQKLDPSISIRKHA